jgi:hypothetical protein
MGTFEWIILGATVWFGWLAYCFLAGKPRDTEEEYAERNLESDRFTNPHSPDYIYHAEG